MAIFYRQTHLHTHSLSVSKTDTHTHCIFHGFTHQRSLSLSLSLTISSLKYTGPYQPIHTAYIALHESQVSPGPFSKENGKLKKKKKNTECILHQKCNFASKSQISICNCNCIRIAYGIAQPIFFEVSHLFWVKVKTSLQREIV